MKKPVIDQQPLNGAIYHLRTEEEARQEAERKKQLDLLNLMFQQSLIGIFFMMLDEPVVWNDSIDKEKTLDYIFEHQRITKINQAMLDQYCASEKDMIGLTPNILFHHDLEQGRQVWKHFFDSGQLHIDTDERRLDGSQMSVRGDYICLYDDEGRVIGHFGIQLDISDRKLAEEKAEQYNKELHEKSHLLEMILDNAPVGIWLNNTKSETIFMNKFGQDHFNLSEQELAVCQQTDRDIVSKDRPQHYEELVTFQDNKQHIVETVKTKITGADGSLLGILAIGLDVTKQKEVVNALQQSEERYRMLAENIKDVIWTLDPETGRFLYVSPSVYALRGYTPEEIMAKSMYDALTPESAAYVRQKMANTLTDYLAGKPLSDYYDEVEQPCKDGTTVWTEVITRFFLNPQTGRVEICGVTRDITARKQTEAKLQQSETKYRALLEHATQAIVVIQNGRLMFCNPHTVKLLGYELEETVGSPFIDFIHPQDVALAQANYNRRVAGEDAPARYEFRLLRKTNGFCWVEIYQMFIDWNGDAAVLGFISDINDRKTKEQEIQYHSYHDHLTDLYNRRYYEEVLKRFDHQEYLPFSIILGDVNGLKLTNDAFGHLVGDKLLQTVAGALKSVCRANDVAARIGGDEFALLLPHTSAAEAEQVARSLEEEISRQSDLVVVSLSVGWATKTNVLEKSSRIYMQAEDMMYKNKLTESLQLKRTLLDKITRKLYEQNSYKKHAVRVSKLCEQTGIALGLESRQINELRTAGLMHDIGKIGINAAGLYKQEPLSEADKLDTVRHPEIGYNILHAIPEHGESARIVLAHHEHWDGTGYPKGLSGHEIPLASRIIHVAEAYDSMVHGLNCHKSWDEAEVIQELRLQAGSQFDPAVVEVFVEHVLPQIKASSDF